MEDLLLTLSVALMFFLRIGIPVLVLVALGAVIDRWQSRRDDYIRRYYDEHPGA
jgi:hypothetical protein